MDLSDEVSLKMKSAIKARLKELGIIWDRELPDYVMVLVANKKTKEQMEKDLHIFLGPHTPDFTSWLHNVLKKLEECAVTSKGSLKKKEERKIKAKRRTSDDKELEPKKFRLSDTKNGSDSDDSSISSETRVMLISDPHDVHENNSSEKDIFEKRIESLDQCRIPEKEENRRPRERIQINWDEEKPSKKEGSQPPKGRRDRSRSKRSESRGRRSRSKSRNRSRSSSRLKDDQGVSVLKRLGKELGKYTERRSKSRERKPYRDAREFIKSRISQENNGYGVRSSKKGDKGLYEKDRKMKNHSNEKKDEKLPSLVKITPRPVRPLSMQPSSNLILKAVADAQKSIAITSLPQPEDKLGHDEVKKPIVLKKKPIFKKMRGSGFEPNISVTLLNDRVSSNKSDIPESEEIMNGTTTEPVKSVAPQDVPEVPRFTISLQSDDDSIITSDIDENDLNGIEDTFIEVVDPSVPQTTLEPMETNGDNMEESEVPEFPIESIPRFDRSRLGPRVVPVVPDTDTVLSCLGEAITKTIVNENAFSEGSLTNSEENDKLIKCKFWPTCEAGDTCRFYHPKTYCRTLPNCKYGQKCLYYHPPCKFGDKCLNVTCPYTHNAAAVAAAPSAVKGKVWTKVPLAPSNGQICMFYPNCTKPFCPYQHYAAPGCGIPCKYGSSCTKVGCEFDHPQSSKNPYKWVAQGSE